MMDGKKGSGMKVGEGKCGGAAWQKRYKGNKYRSGNDDGGRQSRQAAGGMDRKHKSPTI